jgi:hypothetical protein
MGTAPDWPALLADGVRTRSTVLRAVTFHGRISSFSRPARVTCDDGNVYIVKGRQNGRGRELNRALVNDHVVGRLGMLLGAAVADVALVDVSELAAIEPGMADMMPSVAHATRLVPEVSDRRGVEYFHVPENRPRFGTLAVLYSWAGCFSDHQLIYGNNPPNLVYSVDHGHFFGNGPVWTVDVLKGRPEAALDRFFDPCSLTQLELGAAAQLLAAITDREIAGAVAGPLDDWEITQTERIALAEYLIKRKGELVALLLPTRS